MKGRPPLLCNTEIELRRIQSKHLEILSICNCYLISLIIFLINKWGLLFLINKWSFKWGNIINLYFSDQLNIKKYSNIPILDIFK